MHPRSHTWDRELFERAHYQRVFEDLRCKSRKEPARLSKDPVDKGLTLGWVLFHEAEVTDAILEFLRAKAAWQGPEHAPERPMLGEYQLSLLRQGSKERRIYVSSWGDRILQMVMAKILTDQCQGVLSSGVYSFQKGKGTLDVLGGLREHLRRHQGQSMWIIKRDVTKYGDSVPHALLMEKLFQETSLERESLFAQLLWECFRNPYRRRTDPEPTTCNFVGIPSGSPLVPPLENFYLVDLDRQLMSIQGGFYARYGDDFLFAHADLDQVRDASRITDRQVAALGLSIKEEKKKNLCLLRNYSRKNWSVPDFEPLVSFEHLGRRVSYDGKVGPKRDAYQQARVAFKNRAIHLIRFASAQEQGVQARIQIVKAGLRQYFFLSQQSPVVLLVYASDQESLILDFDRYRVRVLTDLLEMHWKLRRREVWRVLKKLECPSLMHLYRTRGRKRLEGFEDQFHEDLRLIA